MKDFINRAVNASKERAKEEHKIVFPFLSEIQKLQQKYCGVVGFWIHTQEEYGYLSAINVTVMCNDSKDFDFYSFESVEKSNEKLSKLKNFLKQQKEGAK